MEIRNATVAGALRNAGRGEDVGGRLAVVVLAATAPAMGAVAAAVVGGDRSVGDVAAGAPSTVQPANYAFVVWAAIYLALAVHAVDHARRGRAGDPLLQATRQALLVALVAHHLWAFAWLTERYGTAAALTGVMLVSLSVASARAATVRVADAEHRSRVDPPLRATLGLFGGWVTVAAVPSVAIAAFGDGGRALDDATSSAVVLALVSAWAVAAVARGHADGVYALTVAWGLVAVLVGALDGAAVTVATAAAALVALAVAVGVRNAGRRSRHITGSIGDRRAT